MRWFTSKASQEAMKPKTCEGCKHYEEKQCTNENSIAFGGINAVYKDDFCNAFEPKETAMTLEEYSQHKEDYYNRQLSGGAFVLFQETYIATIEVQLKAKDEEIERLKKAIDTSIEEIEYAIKKPQYAEVYIGNAISFLKDNA